MTNNKDYIKKLRLSGLRPTRQRIKICEALFDSEKTFHFTINDLSKIIQEKLNEKIALATVYNTVHAFKEKGYLKEISINSDKSYFDTNILEHHHFFDEDSSQLIDIKNENVSINNLPSAPNGKKIKEIEIVIQVASNNQKQKNY